MFCSQCGEQNGPKAKFCFQCGSPLAGDVTSELRPGATAAEVRQYLEYEDRAYGTANLIGVVLIGIAALGLWTTVANPPVGQNTSPLPNIINMTLLAAFGVAVVGKKRIAIGLGWAYLALLMLMTLAHGFIPLEIAQVLALVWFLFHLRRKLATKPARST